jgi:pimeloyl-ACP methyl ester carboxylesterase
MAAIPLRPGLTRGQADAVLAPTIDDPRIRGFLLQSLVVGQAPRWRIGLAEIAAALPEIEAWDAAEEARYPGPALFLGGDRSDYIREAYRPAIRALFPAARFATLRDAGHWLHADNPDGFLAVVDSALG